MNTLIIKVLSKNEKEVNVYDEKTDNKTTSLASILV